MRNFLMIVLIGSTLMLSGCLLEPDYQRPKPGTATQWPTGPAYDEDHAQASNDADAARPTYADIGWREFFTDPRLKRLIEIALKNNTDLRIAALNIQAARAQYRIQRGDLFPTINATGTELAEHNPSGLSNPTSSGGSSAQTGGGGGTFHYYNVGIGFTAYELDLFGRIRSLDHQALQQYFSEQETQRSTRISLIAEIASDYLTFLSDQALLKITEDTLKSQQDSYDLTKHSYDYGIVTGLDLSQAETSVDTARANLEQYRRRIAQDKNALVLLLGAPLPADLPAGYDLDGQKFLETLSPGLPSDLLQRRPDVLAAEHQLIGANANIGAARAAFFPSISLTGSFGTASSQLSGLFKDGSQAWTFSPKINLPIFAAGANIANLDLAKVEKNVYVAQYRKAVQTAFREVADALAARGTLDNQLHAERKLVDAAHNSFSLSQMRFRHGVDNYLSVLDSQRTLYSAQQSLIDTKLSRLQNLVTLYKALGGGWKSGTDNVAVVTPPNDHPALQLQMAGSLRPSADSTSPERQ